MAFSGAVQQSLAIRNCPSSNGKIQRIDKLNGPKHNRPEQEENRTPSYSSTSISSSSLSDSILIGSASVPRRILVGVDVTI